MDILSRNAIFVFMPLVLALIFIGCIDNAATDKVSDVSVDYVGDPVDNGEISYALYCTSCHGERGVGDGPVASALTTVPADLTKLTQKYDGIFPAEEIYAYVDGRRDVAAHGTRDMPVWGQIWQKEGSMQSAAEVDIRLRELVEYIRSMQI